MLPKQQISIFWFRRDLRINDNAGLYYALKSNTKVLCIFIFDTYILDALDDKKDKRVSFIYTCLEELDKKLQQHGSPLLVVKNKPVQAFLELTEKFSIKTVYTNHDYEPYAIERDNLVEQALRNRGIEFKTFKDQVIFEKSEIIKDDATPYTVFTPYAKQWKKKLNSFFLNTYPTEKYLGNLYQTPSFPKLSINAIGFEIQSDVYNTPTLLPDLISNYQNTRNFPFINGTSKLSVHIRFGTVSIRDLTAKALKLNEHWLNELIWREFFMQIMYHFPYVVTKCFKSKYEKIAWINNENDFEKWCNGNTGYPIVDAGMRELNATGYMHNRVRMITASFLVKHLLIDWRWGEAYFAKKLLDFDLSANNGNWQWAAGCGCDAAPYFRIFNPYEQTKKFDPEYKYIQKWVPEYSSLNYSKPIINHSFARERVLKTFKAALS